MSGHIFAFVTATAVRFGDTGDSDDYSEEYGWIDPSWSREVLHESRNDVRPIVDCDDDDEDLADYVREAIESGPCGRYWDNGDGTFYGQGEHLASDGTVYTYAVHFVRKWHASDGWREDDWHPTTDGGIELGDLVTGNAY